ncbi:MAG: ABC transporter ATP-binding protein [Candidatus Izemoplasmatales bacterium]|nr:ABC transporter ATP-binding protein [Candidatus Izemoplasmatales bacterium]
MPRTFGDIDKTNRTMSDMEIVKRLLIFVKPFLWPLFFAFVLVLGVVGLDLMGPLILASVIDYLGADSMQFSQILLYVGYYLIIMVVGSVISYFQAILLQTTGQKIIFNIREKVFNHIERLSISQFNRIPIGKLVTRVTSDTDTLNQMYTDVIINLFRNVITIVVVFVIMFIKDFRLTLYISAVVPFVFIASVIFRKYSREAYWKVRGNLSIINAFLSEHLSGMKLIQIFNREEKKYQNFKDQNLTLNKSYLRQTFTFALYRPFMYMLFVVSLVIILWAGSLEVLAGVITYGMLFAFTQYISKFFNPIQDLAEKFDVLQSAFTSGERIFTILDTVPIVKDSVDATDLETFQGEIEFKNVWFAYNEGDWVLRDVSFRVRPKETMAIVGATGSGKTTIISLIVRNYDIQKGQILIDGRDIRSITLDSLRAKVGQMLQDVFLFSGTISSNIRLRNEDISDQEIVDACHYVNADRFIEKLDQKYEDPVRERGNNFSAGQRQLLSFARTLVHKPSVMILDEATANIDTETEEWIQESLHKMMNISTMIIVAHRLSTIQHADKILVMQKGKIIEEGNHQELLKQKGHYYQLYRLQYDKEHLLTENATS